jgi:uncharacterized membrane protein YeiH
MTIFNAFDFISLIDLLGTFAFAVSGIKLASRQRMDWFGAYIIGLVTAIGGGTVRDVLLDTDLFWIEDPTYLTTTAVALVTAIIFNKRLFRLGRTLFIFDTIGLGLFTVVGIEKSLEVGLPFWACIGMGAVTGSVGGVIRDILINEVPLLFRQDIYALACIAGGLVYFGLFQLNCSPMVIGLISAFTVIFIRLVAVKYHIHLPTLKTMGEE